MNFFDIVDILYNASIGNANINIWFINDVEFTLNCFEELRGKFYVEEKKYHLAFRSRHYATFFVSFDESQTYELVANMSGYTDSNFHTDNNKTYIDFECPEPQWNYFKKNINC